MLARVDRLQREINLSINEKTDLLGKRIDSLQQSISDDISTHVTQARRSVRDDFDKQYSKLTSLIQTLGAEVDENNLKLQQIS